MLVGLAPISYYRTLNLPAVEALTEVAMEPMSGPVFEPMVLSALRATGTSLRVFSPAGKPDQSRTADGPNTTARRSRIRPWPDGSTAHRGRTSKAIGSRSSRSGGREKPPVRAWFLPLTEIDDETPLDDWSGDPRDILPLFDRADPLVAESPRPEEWTIRLWASEPGWVIVSQLHDPQWTGPMDRPGRSGRVRGDDPAGFPRSAANPGDGSGSRLPGKGAGCSAWSMTPRDAAEGAAIATIAWSSWLVCAFSIGLRAWPGDSGPRRVETET